MCLYISSEDDQILFICDILFVYSFFGEKTVVVGDVYATLERNTPLFTMKTTEKLKQTRIRI